MQKLHKGQSYQSLPLSGISPQANLRFALFAYLPRNDRMLKVRDRGQLADARLLESLARGGHGQLFMLDPLVHPEAHEREPEPVAAPPPSLEAEATVEPYSSAPRPEDAARLFPAFSTDRHRNAALEELAAQIREKETMLGELRPSSRAFVEGLHQDSSPATEPLARTGFQLRERLARLREEAETAHPKRRQELREQITRTEAAMGLVRELENHLSGPGERAPEAAALAGKVIAQIAGLAEPSPIRREDRAALHEILETVRARALRPDNQPESVLGPELAAKLRALRAAPAALNREEVAEVREAVARKLRRVRAAIEVSEQLAERREELLLTLEEAPTTEAGGSALEERALRLQREIGQLEEKAEALRGGADEVPSGNAEGTPAGTPGELWEEAESLAKEASRQRAAAQISGERLRKKVFGHTEAETQAPSAGSEADAGARLPLLCAPELAALDLARAEVHEAQRLAAPESEIERLRESVGRELHAARTIVSLKSKLSAAEIELTELLGEEPTSEEERFERDTEALLLQKDIREMRAIREELRRGAVLDPERLAPFAPAAPAASLADSAPTALASPATSPAAELERLRNELDSTKLSMVHAAVNSALSADALEQALGAHGTEAQKQAAVKTPGLDRLHHVVGRRLRAFLETGKDPDPGEVWEINHLLAKNLGLARAETNLARRITSLVEEHRALLASPGAPTPEHETRLKAIREEIEQLSSAAKALENGDLVDVNVIAPFLEPAEPELHFSPDFPTEENQRRVLAGIENAREELVRVKAAAMGAATVVRLQASPAERPPVHIFAGAKADHRLEEEIRVRGAEAGETGGHDKLFSAQGSRADSVTKLGSEGERDLQASVYAACLLRAFGYRSPELEEDLILACLLWRASDADLGEHIPERVLLIHRAAHAAHREGEMALRDLALAARLGREYLGMPGVVTGAFSLKPDLFDAFCARVLESGLPVDQSLLERARQAVAFRLADREREELLQAARYQKEQIDRWGLPALSR